MTRETVKVRSLPGGWFPAMAQRAAESSDRRRGSTCRAATGRPTRPRVEDPFDERDTFAGSDRARIATLRRALPQEHPAWRALPRQARATAESTLQVLSATT